MDTGLLFCFSYLDSTHSSDVAALNEVFGETWVDCGFRPRVCSFSWNDDLTFSLSFVLNREDLFGAYQVELSVTARYMQYLMVCPTSKHRHEGRPIESNTSI